MPSDRLLTVNDGLAIQPGRSRLVISDSECCCGTPGCPLWTRIVQCSTGPSCSGEPSPFVEAWICSTVTCTNGQPLHAGTVFLLDETCWTVQLEQLPVPPPGSMIVEGTDPVECVSNCFDVRCPQGEQFLVSRPCNTGHPVAFVCGVNQCGVYELPQPYGCSIVDPADGYIPGASLPPGAVTINAAGLPVRPDCCSCGDIVTCASTPPLGFLFNPPGSCDQNPPCLLSNDPCCCEREESGAFRGRVRLVNTYQTRQIQALDGAPSGTFFGELTGANSIDPATGFACYGRQIRTVGFGVPPSTTPLPDLCYADACGWSGVFPGQSPPFDPSIGRWQCSDCQILGIGSVVFQAQVTCGSIRVFNSYVVTSPQAIETFTLLYEARIDNISPCGGGCNGRALSAPARASSGCSGCNPGNTTRLT